MRRDLLDEWSLRRVLIDQAPLVLVAVIAVAGLCGCQPGIAWRLGRFEDGFAEAQAAGKLTFVYFRNWYSVDCTTFEEQVLKQPSVLQATSELVCVPLEYDVDRKLAEGWGISRVPAFVIVGPGGTVFESASGQITADDVVNAVRRARQRLAAEKSPATGS
jgi:hypothetical protein